MFNSFDTHIISWFEHSAGQSWVFDYCVYAISDNHLLKGGLFFAALWAFWFAKRSDQQRNRSLVLATLFACVVAIALNQSVQLLTPMRPRPYLAGLPGIHFPYDLGMRKESSFPSDHATLFFALSTGLLFLSRSAGIAAFLYAVFVICLPRIYLGLHYPSDLLGGACIGTFCSCCIVGTRLNDYMAKPLLAFAEKHPGLFYAGFFLFSYQLATLFDALRAIFHCLHVIASHVF